MNPTSEPDRPPVPTVNKGRDRAIGFLGQLALFGLAYVIVARWPQVMSSGFLLILGMLNLFAVLFFAGRRPQIAVGAMLVWALAFALVVVAFVFLLVTCATGGLNL